MRDDISPLIDDLEESGALQIQATPPLAVNDQIQQIDEGGYDGILLDYVLAFRADAASRPSLISNSLAQSIRDQANLGNIADLPIVLWSSNENFRSYYEHDTTAKDLYDYRIDKLELPKIASSVSEVMLSLSDGYAAIRDLYKKGWTGFAQMLDLDPDKAETVLDPRIGDMFRTTTASAHDYARYILTELLEQPEPLVDASLLAARLGIDNGALRSDDWQRLVDEIIAARYLGVFSSAWVRFWWPVVDAWWTTVFPGAFLQSMTAEERITRLNEAFGTSFMPAQPISEGYSTAFWAVCEATGRPIDPGDAVLSANTSLQPWHSSRYISIDAALRHIGVERGLMVHPIDRDRLDAMRQQLDAGK